MATTAYLRVSTESQDLKNQKFTILEYAARKKFPIDHFVEIQISSRRTPQQRGIDGLLERLAPKDRLIVSELSRLGRSLGQVIHIVDELLRRKIRFTAIKEDIHFEGMQDLQTKVMIALFGLFAEVERDLISERTREGLAAARAKGRMLGRPKGSLGKSRMDGKEEEIRILLQKRVSKASIAKIFGVARPTIHHFIETRRLQEKDKKTKTGKGQPP
jgi:DNA invertase Pin-like site-specific DNA recombinase